MNSYTPGPWFGGSTISEGTYCIVGDGDSVVCEFRGRAGETVDADARLIAAAPELLEALQAIDTGNCENFTTGHGSCAKNGHTIDAEYTADRICDSCIAHAAIAKAVKS